MKKILIKASFLFCCSGCFTANDIKSSREHNAEPKNNASINKMNLLKTIYRAAKFSAALFIGHGNKHYPIGKGKKFREKVLLFGINGSLPGELLHRTITCNDNNKNLFKFVYSP